MAKIVSVHSFRGGTGKSNLVANLAVTLAQRGSRVGIIDTDIQSPGIHVLFGLDEEKVDRALNDYLWGECAIEDTAYEVSPAPQPGPSGPQGEGALAAGGAIYLVPSSLKAGEIARVLREGYDVGRLNDGFHELITRLNLGYLLIDTHPGLNEETLLSIAISDSLIVILRPDRQDYQGTAVTMEVARKLEVPHIALVVNKVLPEYDLEALRQEVESSYGAPLAAVLPLSEDMIRLASGQVFCLRHPGHPISRQVWTLAGGIAG
jgi:MinD-like ATPase involved in chromosome partitioning or flagellar assembly